MDDMEDRAMALVTTTPNQPVYTLETTIMITIACVFNLISISGNVLVLYVVSRMAEEMMGNASKVFYMSQASTDLIAAGLYFIAPLAETIGDWVGWSYGRQTFCRTVGFMASVMPSLSSQCILLLNIDRYIYIVKPLLYARISTKNRAIAVSLTISVLTVTSIIIPVYLGPSSFGIIRYNAEMRMCIIDYVNITALPVTLVVTVPILVNVSILFILYFHIIAISLRLRQTVIPLKGANARKPINPPGQGRTGSPKQGKSFSSLSERAQSSTSEGAARSAQNTQEYASKDRAGDHDSVSINTRNLLPNGNSVIPGRSVDVDASTRNPTSSKDDASSSVQINVVGVPSSGVIRPAILRGHGDPSGWTHILRLVRTPATITTAFLVSFLPLTITGLYLAPTSKTIEPRLFILMTSLVCVNGGFNLLIYYVTIKAFRKTFRSLLHNRLRCCCT